MPSDAQSPDETDRGVVKAYCVECGDPTVRVDGEYCSDECKNGERINDTPL